jgi:orotate phosphoribosyltransferase
MEKSRLAERMRACALLTGRFRLRSGRSSSFYWDKYRFESDPVLLSAVVDYLEELLPSRFDKLAGMELGGIPLATALSLKTGLPCLYVRKTAKTYGTCNLIEGGFDRGERVVLIEDVITTAGQVCTSVKEMRDLGLLVDDVACVIEREGGGRKRLERIGCSLVSVFTLGESGELV